VQSLTANTKALQQKELEAQYRAQMDVLEQLQEKIMKLLQQQTQTTAVTKLQRDFERVKQRVTVIEDGVERILKSQKQQLANKSILDNTAAPETAEDSYQRMQLQMQQDVSRCLGSLLSFRVAVSYSFISFSSIKQRLAEEIMREREEEIRNINRGMHQVNEIYKDLAHIVGSQQEQIDTIENQMEESKVNAESGLKQVERANEKYGSGQCVIS
jgi:syntaxin 7